MDNMRGMPLDSRPLAPMACPLPGELSSAPPADAAPPWRVPGAAREPATPHDAKSRHAANEVLRPRSGRRGIQNEGAVRLRYGKGGEKRTEKCKPS